MYPFWKHPMLFYQSIDISYRQLQTVFTYDVGSTVTSSSQPMLAISLDILMCDKTGVDPNEQNDSRQRPTISGRQFHI